MTRFVARIVIHAAIWILLVAQAAGCGEPGCPYGYYKKGGTCFRNDAGLGDADATDADDDPVIAEDGAAAALDGAVDAAVARPDTGVGDGSPGPVDAMAETTTVDAALGTSDASTQDAPAGNDATTLDAPNTDVCSPSPCLHGGNCTRSAQKAVCECEGTGYTGERCEIDIDECAQPNLCTNPEYPCVQTEPPGYTCEGLMADWPMPDAVPTANVRPNYDTTSITGVVLDKVTGLAWQRNPPAVYDRCSGNIATAGDSCTWEEAKTYCTRLELGGSDDWRLPSKIELESIADHTRPQQPAINPDVFPNAPLQYVWSRSSYSQNPASAWMVAYAADLPAPKTRTGVVRCVRTARLPASGTPNQRYTVTGASSLYPDVADRRTGLVWKLKADETPYDLETAKTHCAAFGGAWRVPTAKELLTLVDLRQSQDAAKIDPTFAISLNPNAELGTYSYRSVSLLPGGGLMVAVNFANGATHVVQNVDLVRVRCVR